MLIRWLLGRAADGLSTGGPVNLNLETSFDGTRSLAFMHIPKTSGTALMSTLTADVEPSAVVRGFDLCLFGAFRQFDTFDATERERIYHAPSALPAESKLILGHFAFSTLRHAYPNAQIMTVLRDPIARLLSHWMFWRKHTDDLLQPFGSWADVIRHSRLSLASFLKLPILACQVDNLILRMLLWPHPLIREDQFIDPVDDEQLLSDAVARLNAFDFVDVIENVDFARNLENWMGQKLSYKSENETRDIPLQFRTPLHLELKPEAYALLMLRSRLDLRLWQIVVKQRLPGYDSTALREQSTLAAVARYGALMMAE